MFIYYKIQIQLEFRVVSLGTEMEDGVGVFLLSTTDGELYKFNIRSKNCIYRTGMSQLWIVSNNIIFAQPFEKIRSQILKRLNNRQVPLP